MTRQLNQAPGTRALAVPELRAKFDRMMRTLDTRFTGFDLAWFRAPIKGGY